MLFFSVRKLWAQCFFMVIVDCGGLGKMFKVGNLQTFNKTIRVIDAEVWEARDNFGMLIYFCNKIICNKTRVGLKVGRTLLKP